MVSYRFVPAICSLLALALVPTLIHSYSPSPADDGRNTSAIANVLDGVPGVQTRRSPTWGARRFNSDDWIEREYRDLKSGSPLKLTVVRTLDAKSVYHHPELAVTEVGSFDDAEIHRFDARPDIPVYVLSAGAGSRARAVYALHYDDGYVENPILFQLRNAGELLIRSRQPMTLFFVLDPNGNVESGTRLLFAAIDSFLNPPPR